jgi:cell division septation protein DedD
MNKNIIRSLAVGAVLLILLVVLYRLFIASPPPTGPSPVTAPAPPPVPGAAPAPKEPPAAPLIEPAVPPKSTAPSPEVSSPAPKVMVSPPSAEKDQYGLLVGSYRQYREAARMLARLKKQGEPAFIRRKPGKGRLYQVWLGPFSSQQEGKAAEKSLGGTLKGSPQVQKLPTPVPK